jgi:RNA polymerase sigma-70 factor (ECF subfamily)
VNAERSFASEPADAVIVARALGGDETGYRALMERYRDTVYRFVRAQIDDGDAAFDIVQECFISAFTNLNRYDSTRPFRAWIIRIALNKCRDWRRRRIVRSFFTRARPIEDGFDIADEAPGADAKLAARSDLRRARIAIDRLPENLRAILLLRAVEGLSQTEVAGILGVSEKAVETRLYRARVKMTEMMRDDKTVDVS